MTCFYSSMCFCGLLKYRKMGKYTGGGKRKSWIWIMLCSMYRNSLNKISSVMVFLWYQIHGVLDSSTIWSCQAALQCDFMSCEILWLGFLNVNRDFIYLFIYLVPTDCASTELTFSKGCLVLPENLAPTICKVICPKSKYFWGRKCPPFLFSSILILAAKV